MQRYERPDERRRRDPDDGADRYTAETREMSAVDPVGGQTNVNVQPAAYGPAPASHYDSTAVAATKLIGVLYLLFGIIEAIIFIRFLLRALAANTAAGFAQFIYGLSGPFVAPFEGLLGAPGFGGAVFDFSSLIAILIYALISVAIARLIRIVFIDSPANRR